jgi:hypothetical protein
MKTLKRLDLTNVTGGQQAAAVPPGNALLDTGHKSIQPMQCIPAKGADGNLMKIKTPDGQEHQAYGCYAVGDEIQK